MDNEGQAVAIPLDILRRHDDDIHRLTDAKKVHVDFFRQTPTVEVPALDDQQIDIAVGSHLVPCGGPEQDDFVRLRDLDDALDNGVQGFLVDGFFVTHLLYLSFPETSLCPYIGYVRTLPLSRHQLFAFGGFLTSRSTRTQIWLEG